MMVVPAGVRVLIAARPVDFRKGMDGLAAVAKETLAMIRAFCSAVQARRRPDPVNTSSRRPAPN